MKFGKLLLLPLTIIVTGAVSWQCCSPGVLASESAPGYHVIKKIPLGEDGFWDYLTIDASSRRLYVGRGNRVMVVDIDTDKLVGELSGAADSKSGTAMAGVHGVCVPPGGHKAYVTSGKDDTVRIFDLKSLKQTGQVKAGSKPDAIVYDPSSKTIFAFNNGGTTATAIDPVDDKTRTLELGGAPESAVPDGKGKMFVNLEDKSEIAVIDTKKMTVTDHWSLAPGTEPTGLALDVKHGRLFSACKNKTMCILDAQTGKLITSLPIGGSVDFALFDPERQDAFASNGDGTMTVIHEATPNSFAVTQTVETQKGARTMAMDARTHHIWLATAKVGETPAAEGEKRPHRVMEPGSFVLIVVGQK